VVRGLGDQADTNFIRGASYKIWEGQKSPKFGAFSDNFRCDRECLRNASTCRKSEYHLINYISSSIGRKKYAERYAEKVIDALVDLPNWTYFGWL